MNFAWLKPLIFRTKTAVIRNAPAILNGMGTAGSISALIFGIKATPAAVESYNQARLDKVFDGKDDSRVGKLTVPEAIKACWKHYIPSAGMELFSLACFWSAHGISAKRQALLMGLYSTAEATLQEYQRKVSEMIGKEGEREIRKSIGQDFIDQNPPPSVIMDAEANRWCIYDNQYFPSSYLKLKDDQNVANRELIENMYLSKLELKWILDPSAQYLKAGTDDGDVGWSVDKLMEFDIEPGLGRNHEPVLMLEIRDKNGNKYDPKPGYASQF